MTQLIAIGFWADYQHPDWPTPQDFITPDLGEDETQEVTSYLDQGTVVQVWRGWSRCRICGYDENGHADLTDGTYLWPEGLAHYCTSALISARPPTGTRALRGKSGKRGETVCHDS